MLSARALRTFSWALLICQLCGICAQGLPPVACPEYFQYATDGFEYFGKISFSRLPTGTNTVRASFSQRGLPQSSYYGSIEPYPNKRTAIADLLAGRPVVFRVNFAVPSAPPKLTALSLNGNEVCVGDGYPPPNSWYELSYTLYTLYVRGEHEYNHNNAWHFVPIRQPVQSPTQWPASVSKPQPLPLPLYTTAPAVVATTTTTTAPPPIQWIPAKKNVTNTHIDLDAICGVEGSVVRPFVYGGIDVTRGQFPWLTAIYKKDTDGLTFKCGGTLVTRRNVISAAHCFKNLKAEQAALFFGRNDLQSFSEDELVSRDVLAVVMHPDYRTNMPNADLAILKMEPLDSFTRYIKPICLWSESAEREFIVGQTGTVVGWGFGERGSDEVTTVPKMVDVKIVSNDECLKSSDAFKDLITESTICAGNRDGKGPCMGDSGSGLIILRKGRWTLRGIVSVGQSARQQCNLYEYVVYCDVAQYMTWVQENIHN